MPEPKNHCILHPPGPAAQVGFFNFLELYPVLAIFVQNLKQSEILCLMLTCKHICAILNRNNECINNLRGKAIPNPKRELCESCSMKLTFCVKCDEKFHVRAEAYSVNQVYSPLCRSAYICRSCYIKLPETSTSSCCHCDRSVKYRFICNDCIMEEQVERMEAHEPFVKHKERCERAPTGGRNRCQCGQCGRFIKEKDTGKAGPVQVCRWCGRISDHCPVGKVKDVKVRDRASEKEA